MIQEKRFFHQLTVKSSEVPGLLRDFAKALDDGIERQGADADEPEGSRYVKVTDTVMKLWAENLRTCAEALEK